MSKQAECHGLATQHFNMVAPQKFGQDSEVNQESWQVVKSKKTLRAEKIWKKNYPTISKDKQASSPNIMEYSSDSSSYSDAVKRNINKDKANFWDTYKSDSDEDNQSTNSSTFRSFSIAFPNKNNIITKEEKVGTDIKKENKKLKRKAKNLKKYIKKLQKQVHVQTQHNINRGIDKECAFSANIIDNNNNSRSTYVPAEEENTEEQNIATQNTLKRVATEEDDLAYISMNVEIIKESFSPDPLNNQPAYILNIATDLDHIQDHTNYTDEINKTLPKLFDQFYPPSNREMAFIHQDLLNLKNNEDWLPFGLERGLELERIQSTMFYNQLMTNNMTIGWNKLYEFLQEHWDALGIPYKNRHKLMTTELEFASLLMCDVLPKNYKEQGIWVNDPSQGRYYKFFSGLNIHEARRKWLNIISYDCYLWFWNIYAGSKPISTLNDKEIVKLFDLFDIIKFINPKAIRTLLEDKILLQKYTTIYGKAMQVQHYVTTRHQSFYLWMFYGWRELPNDYPAYDSSGTNSIHNATKWISNLTSCEDFFKNYKHYYINELEGYGFDYYSYESPPTLDENTRWLASPNNFYPKFDLLNGVRSAQNKDNVTLYFCDNLKTRNLREELIQNVNLESQDNRIHHYEMNHHTYRSVLWNNSLELPIDWLNWYDALSRIKRNPENLYGYNIFSVPTLILPDKSLREDYFYSTEKYSDSTILIPSKSKKITCCHSPTTLQKSTIKIFSPTSHIFKDVQCPFLINNAKQHYEHPGHTPSEKDTTYTYIYNGNLKYSSIPYMDELSFTTKNFKNLYFHNINYDKKQITEKYGIQYDPLLDHIDLHQVGNKNELFSSKNTYLSTGRTLKNIKNEFDEHPSLPPIDRMMNRTYDSSNTYIEPSRRTEIISDAPVRTPDPQENSENPSATADKTYLKISGTNEKPTEIIFMKNKLPSRSPALSSRNFSFPSNRIIPKKRSSSFDDVSDKLRRSEPVEKLVSAKHHVRTFSENFDEYSSPSIIPTYEFAFATAVRTEAGTDDLVPDPSVVTCDSGNHVPSKNIDSKFKIIDESIEARVDDTILDNSSKILANNNDVDISLIKHTETIKKTMTDAKVEFDNYIIKNLDISNKDNDKNKSITARESQIKSLLDDKTIKEDTNSIISFPLGNISQSQSSEINSKIKRLENKNLSKSITLPSNSYDIPPQVADNSEFTFPSDHTSTASSSSSKVQSPYLQMNS